MNRNSININLLRKIHRRGATITAQCPACHASNQDRSGNHLVVFPSGHFACIAFPGPAGHAHRQEIFRIVGIQRDPPPPPRILWKLHPHSHFKPQPSPQP